MKVFLYLMFASSMVRTSGQVTVFRDDFTHGSTVNATSPVAPTPTSTSYEIIASKNYSPNPPAIQSGLKFGIIPTSGGGGEAQALFAASPVTLITAGDYIQLTVTFANGSGLLTQSGELGVGMFNSTGSLPWGGGLNNAADNKAGHSDAAIGGAQNWNGYLAVTDWTDDSKHSRIATRPAQTGADNWNRNQVTAVPGTFSSIYGYRNPSSTDVNTPSSGPNVALLEGGVYADVLTFTLQPDGSIQILNNIYQGDATGTLLSTQTATSDTTPLTTSFDAFSIGFRSAGNVSATTINVSSIEVVKLIQSESLCISAAFQNAFAMVEGQTNGLVKITIPLNSTSGGPLSVNLVSTNPGVAFPGNVSGGSLTVTFPQNSPYSFSNVPITVVEAGSTFLYLTNASAGACISEEAFSSPITVSSSTYSPPALPLIPSGTFNITNFGAVGNGIATNTTAIQATVNAALLAGGGTVEIPAGTFLSGPFSLGSGIRLQLDAGATLLMLPYGSYPGGMDPPDFISVNNAHDIELCGPGTLDGQGAPWWAAGLNESARPYAVRLDDCQRVFIHDWNSVNPPMKHIVFDGIDSDITVQNVTNTAPGSSPNTDGLNLQGTRCLVRDCVFRVGDDNIAMGRSSGPGVDILITNITCGTGHGISIGSITRAGISNVTVVDCTFDGTSYGLRLKADNDRGGLVQNITCKNITLTNVNSAILIYGYYTDGKSLNVTPQLAASYGVSNITSQTPIWRNITFSNITAWTRTEAGLLWGRPEMLVSNVTLDHVTITSPKTFRIYNARGVSLVDTRIIQSSGSTYTLYNAEVTISNRSPGARTVSIDGLTSSNSLALYNAPASMASTSAFGAGSITLTASALTNTGNLTLPASTMLNFALGTNNSLLAETGNLSLNSTINVTDDGGFRPGTFTIARYTGTFSGVPTLGTVPLGYECRLDTSLVGQLRLITSARSPWIGNISLDSGALTVSGTNGPANYTYYLLCSTNVASPAGDWTRLATNRFDALGNFSTGGISNLHPQMFYRLQMP